jgi:hypothetical protein
MKALLPLAEKIAANLIARKQTIAIAESSTGGLVAATLLAVPGASAYFLGGAVVYTRSSRVALLGIGDAEMQGLGPATEAYSLLIARLVRERHSATWAWRNWRRRSVRQSLRRSRAHLPGRPARQSARLRCAPAVQTGWRIWMRREALAQPFVDVIAA